MDLLEELERVTSIDPTTGVGSRFRINLDLAIAVAAARANGAWLGLCLIDVDHFKRVNDKHGHPAGDSVLAELGRRLSVLVDGDERIGRFGGEEFLMLLPKMDVLATEAKALRVLDEVRGVPFRIGDSTEIDLTVSVGVTAAYGDYCQLESMLETADRALYRAKERGRNRSETDHSSIPSPSTPGSTGRRGDDALG